MDQAIHGSSGTLSQHQNLEGMIVSHVDDLLFGGCASAERSLMDVGAELGFREVQREDFVSCSKRGWDHRSLHAGVPRELEGDPRAEAQATASAGSELFCVVRILG